MIKLKKTDLLQLQQGVSMKRSDWGVEIVRIDNGFLIKDNEGKITVVEDKDDDEYLAGEKLLWEIINFFNLEGSRYDKKRLSVVSMVGDKYTPKEGERLINKSYQQLIIE